MPDYRPISGVLTAFQDLVALSPHHNCFHDSRLCEGVTAAQHDRLTSCWEALGQLPMVVVL